MDDEVTSKEGGYFFRKSQLYAAAVLVAALCLMVGLMCGLIPQAEVCESDAQVEGVIVMANDAGLAPGRDLVKEDVEGVVEAKATMPWENLRLPQSVRPSHYKLLLHPDLDTNYFTGNVEITIKVTEAQAYPHLHIKAMDIMGVTIEDMDGNQQPSDGHWFYEPNEFLVVNMTNALDAGDYVIKIDFGGWLNQTIVGFYKSVYTDDQGVEKAIATSKFQPTDARRAFPCFDEPEFKANYTTSLVHPSDYIALSNMDNTTTEDYPGSLKVTHFRESVPMSTYLACFIVCQFKFKEEFTQDGVPFRVYAPEHQIDQVDYALKVGVNVTDFFVEYFDLAYPLPKLDMISIPDFASGAMEHWGLITYRERYLLFDERESSEKNRERIAAVVAHELAHMWFGNIVTCKWWDDLWLNEGFASYMEYLGANSAEPTWKMFEQFVTIDLHYVMGLDQIVSSHPIIVEVNHPDEINEIFDSIPYSKGASVIRMLNNFLGSDVFRAGVSNFLKKYQYGVAITDDLWEELRLASIDGGSEVNVKQIMDTWTRQMGFPVINMTKVDLGSGNYELRGEQEWFLVDPTADKSADEYGSDYGYLWQIPFHYKFEGESAETRTYMSVDGSPFTVPWTASQNSYYVANSGRYGYYRINYDEDTWAQLGEELLNNFENIGPEERAGLIDDSFNLARANDLDYNVALEITKYLEEEDSYVPWDTARDNILWLGEIMRYQRGYGLWRKYIQYLATPLYNSLGWEDNGDHIEKYLRNDILDLSCRHGNRDCLDTVVEIFYDYLNGSYIPPNIRSDVFQFGMQEVGGQEEWYQLLENYGASDVSSERSRLLYGMAQSRIPWILANYLDLLLENNSPVRSQDFFSVVGYVADNPVGNPIAWDWARTRWEEMVAKFGLGSRSLGRMIPSITEYYSTELQLKEMQEFFAEYPEAGAGERGRQQALERVQTNINWVSRNADVVYKWLQDNVV